MSRSLTRVALALLLAVGAAAACWAPTQITVRVETDLPCETVTSRAVAIVVGGTPEALNGASPAAVTSACEPSGDRSDVGSLVLVPSGDRSAIVTIKVAIGIERPTAECLGRDGAGCIVALRRASFIEHRALNVPIRLERACLGVTCDPDSTCSRGSCVALDSCTDGACDPSATGDGGSVVDAAPIACPPGRADCDGDPDNGCEATLGTTEHCGACGHDCGGASCKSGSCEAAVLVTGLDTPRGIAIAGGEVYVGLDLPAPAGSVVRCPLGGCTSAATVSTGHSHPYAFAATNNALFFGDEQRGVFRCALPGCNAPQQACIEGAQSLALNGADVIVASYANAYVGRCTQTSISPVYFAITPGEPLFVAHGGDAVFIAQGTAGGGRAGGIDRCPLPGGCGTTITPAPPPVVLDDVAMGYNQPTSLAVDDAFVYWTESATGNVVRAPKSLDKPRTLIATGTRTRSLVLDGSHVFWIDQGASETDGSIHRANKDGSGHVVLASGERTPAQIALGPTSEPIKRIFWTTRVSPRGDVRWAPR